MYSIMMWNFTSKIIFTILKCIRNVVVITGYLIVIKGGYRFFGYHKNGTLHSRWWEILMLDYYFLEQSSMYEYVQYLWPFCNLQQFLIPILWDIENWRNVVMKISISMKILTLLYIQSAFNLKKKKKGGTLESYLKHWLSWGGITSLTKYASSLLGFLAISNRIKPPVNIFQILP